MRFLATLATRRPWLVIIGWLVAIVALFGINAATGSDLRDTYSLPGTDSEAAYDLLGERFPAQAGDTDTIPFQVSHGSVNDAAVRSDVEAMLAKVAAVPSVASIVSPYSPDAVAQISSDGTIAYATVTYDDQAYNLPIADIEQVAAAVADTNGQKAGDATVTVGHSGQAASRLANPTVGPGELIGLLIAAGILFAAFGSVTAATVPLISAITALAATNAGLGIVSSVSPITTSAPTLAVLLGLGIGIDYALFIVNRHRLGLKAGKTVRDSVVTATTTSGRAVVFAGITVFIALAGMFVPQIAFLSGLATAAAITVLFSVAASITLVPALLALYGHRVLSRRERAQLGSEAALAQSVPQPGRFASIVERRPLVTSLVALAVLAILAAPALSLRLGNADQGNDPAESSTRVAYDLVAKGFGPGANGPLVIAVDLTGPNAQASLTAFVDRVASDTGVAAVVGPLMNPAGDTAVIQALPSTSPQSVETQELVERVRDTYVPEATDITIHVGGTVASSLDFTTAIANSLPVFLLVVVGLSVIVLTVAFRSVVLPLVGAAMNLLSAAAAFGVVVAVFQWGWGHSLIGIGEGGPVEPFAPLILFALLFGLSMDYQVFLVSRIAELWHATGDNAVAVRRGLAEVSRVILAAASIMVVVFGSFVTSDSRVMKLLGLGLAAAVFVDAFVIRVVLMPAVMRLLGRANWWMPSWLDRVLPHLDIDAGDAEAAPSPSVGRTPQTQPA